MMFSLLVLAWSGLSSAAAAQQRPNILMILTDDQGFDDVGFRHLEQGGFRLQTPAIDQLARESVQFSDFCVNPLCGPTRASLLTGRHHLEVGVWGTQGGDDFLDLSVNTFAQELGPLGYKTSFFGKWHSGKTDGYWPRHKGFEYSVMADLYHFYDNEFNINGEPTPTEGWAEVIMAQYALDYLDDYATSGTSEPFLMYYAPMTPHTGLGPSAPGNAEHHAPADMVDAYRARGFSVVMSRLYASIEFMDIQIGHLLTKLTPWPRRIHRGNVFERQWSQPRCQHQRRRLAH
jgi:arylsulfatase A-like enzyme